VRSELGEKDSSPRWILFLLLVMLFSMNMDGEHFHACKQTKKHEAR